VHEGVGQFDADVDVAVCKLLAGVDADLLWLNDCRIRTNFAPPMGV
jgi:hypothetical protein